ncbi:MAG TPA: hypothetical protein ENJ90_01525 [Devosia sp.]|nr:hypothetical protein [Devosia sp.]
MKTHNDYVRHLSELDSCDLPLAGGKAAALGEMMQAGFPVPPGFCLTTYAYRSFVGETGLAEDIIKGLGGVELHERFLAEPLPEGILAQLESAYRALEAEAVSVRSSSTAEDLPQASFAGQQDTFLNVQGLDDIVVSVRKCWASLWTSRVMEYRQRAGFSPEAVQMGVVIQSMVQADSAGVLFSANPVTGNRDQVVINASWGLGEAVVSGLVTPDTLTVDKAGGKILNASIAKKTIMTVRTKAGTDERPVPEAKQTAPVLSDAAIARLVELSKGVEAHENRPMDLEWAFAKDRLHLLQARPITALPEPLDEVETGGAHWSRLMLIERYPDPLTPYTASVMQRAFFQSFDRVFKLMGGRLLPGDRMIGIFFGLPYINVSLMGKSGVQTGNPLGQKENTAGKRRPGLWTLARVGGVLLRTHREWERLQTPFESFARQQNARTWEGASLKQLLKETRDQEPRIKPLLDNHANSIIAAELSLQMLNTLTRNWLGDEKGQLSTTLLSGLQGNMTVRTNHQLWKLARSVRDHAGLRAYLGNPPRKNWRSEILELEGGADFLGGLDRFLNTFGHRSPKYEFRHPSWARKPEQVLEMLHMYMDETIQDPAAGEQRQTAARKEAELRARAALPFWKRMVFNRVLSMAQTYFRLRENQQFYLMMMLPTQQRILEALGQYLVKAGCFDTPDDIYFLPQEKGVALARQILKPEPDSPGTILDARELVQKNRADMERYKRMNAPLHLGGEPVETGTSANITGIAASKGIARGPVRIILDPSGFRDLQPGEILVTPATTPAWTPLFGVAGGLITDFGGMLSHSGVVAREYGLPAVLGVGNATNTLKNGELVEIDGTTGSVRRLGEV